jgi:hypothetical protein
MKDRKTTKYEYLSQGAGVSAEIRSEHSPNKGLECYRYTNLFAEEIMKQ